MHLELFTPKNISNRNILLVISTLSGALKGQFTQVANFISPTNLSYDPFTLNTNELSTFEPNMMWMEFSLRCSKVCSYNNTIISKYLLDP